MTTVVNQPESAGDSSTSLLNTILVLGFLFVLGYVVFAYGLPALQNAGSPQINVPKQVDVNVNQPQPNK